MSTCERCQSEIAGTVYVLIRDDDSDTASGSGAIMVCEGCMDSAREGDARDSDRL